MVKKLLVCMLAACTWAGVRAQVSTTPTPLLENSSDVVVYYYADQGNKGLLNQPESSPIYAHTGVITNFSTSNSDWKYASDWNKNEDKYKMEYVSPNVWKLNIGNIREYYGITDSSVEVTKLAFVFRNAERTREGKTAENGDIFITVYREGLHLVLTSDYDGNVLSAPATINFTASTTQSADISISVNGSELASKANATSVSASYNISAPGTYTVSATASADGQTVTSEEVFAYLGQAVMENYPGGVPQMGAVKNGDGSVTFCLAAPQKEKVVIVGSWDDYALKNENLMKYQDYNGQRYFWITVKDLDNSKLYPYYYLVDGSIKVGDPYARLVLDPYNDSYISSSVYPNLPLYPSDKVEGVCLAVYQGDINDYNWTDKDFVRPDQTDLVIYELLFRDFTGTEGEAKGDGTVNLAMGKLPYLEHLGVNAIELLPINEFNGNISWGYNPNFYFAPDKAYGTPDDYKNFINTCHEKGIAVILDMVFNQTDWQHPWYRMYPEGSNPFYNASAPHAYSVLNDWNQGHPLVQQQFKDVLKYWMEEYHVDGFRFDLVKGLGDNDSYANSSGSATDAYNASRVARMKELHDAMRTVDPTAYFINENLAGSKEENEMAEDGEMNWANVNDQGCQYAMGYSSNAGLNRFYAPSDSRTWGSTVSYLESHDEERLAYKQNMWGAAGIKGNTEASMNRLGSAACQMILCPGSHMIWMFSEMGNDQTTKNSSGNDVGPKKVLWSYLDNEYRAGLVTCYTELIGMRLANPELFGKDASFTQKCGDSDWSAGRWLRCQAGDKELIAVINPTTSMLSVTGVPFTQTDNSAYFIGSKSYGTSPTFNASTGTVILPGNCYVVIASNGVTGVNGLASDSADGCAVWYNLSGMPVYSGEELPALTPGVYIVKRGSATQKVIVNK